MGTGMDSPVLDRLLIRYADNPKHVWDSERIAVD